jgi:hypothetical protein
MMSVSMNRSIRGNPRIRSRADAYFKEGQSAAGTADDYVRLTVFLAAFLFLAGIGSRFPLCAARYGLVGLAAVLLVISIVQLLSLPGPPPDSRPRRGPSRRARWAASKSGRHGLESAVLRRFSHPLLSA